MPRFDIPEVDIKTFTGRKKELEWLDERLSRRYSSFTPTLIFGAAGVGKTTLVKYWLSIPRFRNTPLWLNAGSYTDDYLKELLNEIDQNQRGNSVAVIIDGTDQWNEQQYETAVGKIFNYKAVSSLIFTTRSRVTLKKSDQLELTPMSVIESADLLSKLSSDLFIDGGVLAEAALATNGYPLAISLLSALLKGGQIDSIAALLRQPLYELSNSIFVPKNEIITVVQPIIVTANRNLADTLKKQPHDLHKLTPREFEVLLAELLADMGWEVELTKQTRDGGTDILAYLNTDIGRLLCLVEAKHYRPDRKIGVDLVRTLYGTLCDAQANSAMLVTSSSFTADAREFQQKHQYQLTLRDYADIVSWILKYGSKGVN
jgi:restriction system protein